jgi:ribosomal protein L40E
MSSSLTYDKTLSAYNMYKEGYFNDKRCTKCGHLNDWNAKYCAMCGFKL